jgi:hypothetical protein
MLTVKKKGFQPVLFFSVSIFCPKKLLGSTRVSPTKSFENLSLLFILDRQIFFFLTPAASFFDAAAWWALEFKSCSKKSLASEASSRLWGIKRKLQ